MKSERRHDLQTNELAGRLGTGIEKAQPFVQYIVGGVVIAALLAIGWGVYTSFSRKGASAAWTEYYFTLNAGDAESFKAVANKHPGSAAAIWAEQTAGDEYLADGIDALYRDRGQGVELLKKAITSFEEVNRLAFQPELRTRAVFGLAQAHESLGEIDKAKEHYQQVIAAGLQPAITTVAATRLAFLNSAAGKEFYAWFDKLKPSPAAPPKMPGDLGVPPVSPDLKFDTPIDTSGLELPKAEASVAPGTDVAPLTSADGKPLGLPLEAATPTIPAVPVESAPATVPGPNPTPPSVPANVPAPPDAVAPDAVSPTTVPAALPATEAPATEAPAPK